MKQDSPNKKKKLWYYKENIRIKLTEDDDIPEGFQKGYGPRGTCWNKGLKASEDPRVKANTDKCHQSRKENNTYQAWNRGLTKETDPRVKGNKGERNGMYGKHREAWNKGLNKNNSLSLQKMSKNKIGKEPWNKGLNHMIDSRIKQIPKSEEIKKKISLSHLKDSIKLQRFLTMKQNNNLGKQSGTKIELIVLQKLTDKYTQDDIICQYLDEERYPFICDFYIKSKDLFIEVNGNWTHGTEPFNENNPEHIAILNKWKEKSKKSNYYKNAIYTWTDLDVRKKEIALKNKINYMTIYYKDINSIEL